VCVCGEISGVRRIFTHTLIQNKKIKVGIVWTYFELINIERKKEKITINNKFFAESVLYNLGWLS
jgi:hypothetical protein